MALQTLVARGFRNLAPLELAVPPSGLAIVGPNGAGKSNLLEVICYPVLFRSFRGAPDVEVAARGSDGGFQVEAGFASHATQISWRPRRKEIAVDDVPATRLADVIGKWLAVAFLPGDVSLAGGPAADRRLFLDRMLSLADSDYLASLTRYRKALAQRNSALRSGERDVTSLFERPLAVNGAAVVRRRAAWVDAHGEAFGAELAVLGEEGDGTMRYNGDSQLGEVDAWTEQLEERRPRDEASGSTSVGPHRDDLALSISGNPVRSFGSTGQQRTAAIALKLLELQTLREARAASPALLLDDVFAELDEFRRDRLAARLFGQRAQQIFITAPRPDDLPSGLSLEMRTMAAGRLER